MIFSPFENQKFSYKLEERVTKMLILQCQNWFTTLSKKNWVTKLNWELGKEELQVEKKKPTKRESENLKEATWEVGN